MYSLHLDMWGSSQGTKPTARMKKALVQFSFLLRQTVLYMIDSLSFSPQIFHNLDFHLHFLFTVIFLVIPVNRFWQG